MQSLSREYEVIVCGYGPTGAVAANLLGQRGSNVLVIDRQSDIINIPRAVHFDGEVMRIFQSLGLAEEIRSISHPAGGLRYLDAEGRVLIQADVARIALRHAWPRGHYFNQPELESRLRSRVRQFGRVDVRLGCELIGASQADSHVQVCVRGLDGGDIQCIRAQYLLACDGGSSTIRALMGGFLQALGPSSTWLVCDTVMDRDLGSGKPMYQICDPARPGTLEPCNGRHVRWEFCTLPSDSVEALESEAFTRALIRPYLHLIDPTLRGGNFGVERSKVYTFRSAMASRWRFGRVFLLGDAAHLTPPFLGQGMCAGIRDAFNLVWKLHGVLQGEFHARVLDSYETERKPHVAAAIQDATAIARVIQMKNPAMVWLRDRYFRLRQRIPGLKNLMESEASWSLGPGLFDEDARRMPGRDRHNLFDQAFVRTSDGEEHRMDDLIGPRFAVLLFGRGPAQAFFSGDVAGWTEIGASILAIFPSGGSWDDEAVEGISGVTAVQDYRDTLADWRRRVGGIDAAIVRPDRQIFGGYRGDGRQLSATLDRARTRLIAALGLRSR